MGLVDPRTAQGYYGHLEVDELEEALGMVPEVARAAGDC